jgi:type IV pilus assembly protein PilX
MKRVPGYRVSEQGVALVTSLILLVIITILALSMFRSFGTQERIAGNMREKERALHAAVSAQQYAEWWLTQGVNGSPGSAISCVAGVIPASATEGEICNVTPQQQIPGGLQFMTGALPATGWGWGMSYTPPGMAFGNTSVAIANAASLQNSAPYFASPGYYITDLGAAYDTPGAEAYQIDAYAFGSAQSTVAVVESYYEVIPGVTNLVN